MSEVLQFFDTSLRVLLALFFLVSPGVAFWLVVSFLLFIFRRLARGKLCEAPVKAATTLSSQPSTTH